MSDFQARHVGKTMYQCDGCGLKQLSSPMKPPPALGIFPLPRGWELGVADSENGGQAVYCADCAPEHPLAKGDGR